MKKKMIKNTMELFLLSFFCLYTGYSINKDWKLIFTSFPPITTSFHSIKFADTLNCFIWQDLGGDWGYRFIRTSDGGKTWESVYLDSSYYKSGTNYKFIPALKDIAYPTPNFFIAVGDSGTIIRTTDGGKNWKKSTFNKNKLIYKIRMLDDKYGIFLAGSYDYNNPGGKIFVTYDGGENWIQLNSPSIFDNAYFDDYQIINKNLFYASVRPNGKHPSMLKVTGNWDSWSLDSLKYMFLHMFFLNENEGWLASGNLLDSNGTCSQTIYHTSDGGKHWENQRDLKFNGAPINGIGFFSKNSGIAVSGFGCILLTTNGGRKWNISLMDDPPNDQYYDFRELQVVSENNSYVINNTGDLYKYTRDTSQPQNHAPEIPTKPQGNNPDSVYLSYSYSTKTTDTDGDSVKYYFDWGDDKLSDWTQFYASGEQISVTHSWDTTGFFQVRVKARDKDEMESDWSDIFIVHVIGDVQPKNHPPDAPVKPSGSIVDSIYKNYEYSTKTNDSDGDSVSYNFDWGDSTVSDWTEFFSSGTQVTNSHIWNDTGNFVIKVRAKDTNGALSDWSDTLGIKVVGKIVSVEEIFDSHIPEIFPNPTNDRIRIKDKSIIKSIKILNLYGETVKVISDINNNEIEIPIGALPEGFYEIIIQDEKGIFTRKIIKI